MLVLKIAPAAAPRISECVWKFPYCYCRFTGLHLHTMAAIHGCDTVASYRLEWNKMEHQDYVPFCSIQVCSYNGKWIIYVIPEILIVEWHELNKHLDYTVDILLLHENVIDENSSRSSTLPGSIIVVLPLIFNGTYWAIGTAFVRGIYLISKIAKVHWNRTAPNAGRALEGRFLTKQLENIMFDFVDFLTLSLDP